MNLLEVQDLTKHYPIRAGLLQREVGRVRAVDGVSFHIAKGETLALVGESGCGKTTVSRCVLRALSPTSGAIRFATSESQFVDLATLSKRQIRPLRRHIQMIFQDPYASLNPRMRVGEILAEPLLVHGHAAPEKRVAALLDMVGLNPAWAGRFPHEFSGGQRQRISIARALALDPALIVADEPVSALDVNVQAQVLNLMLELRARLGLAFLFIAHDLAVVRAFCDRVAVMYLGRFVEEAPAADLFASPAHPYTVALLSAVPEPGQRRIVLGGEPPSSLRLPQGCAFRARCPVARPICAEPPPLVEIAPGRRVLCHAPGSLQR
ncbi:MAG: ABC transporter ATP-binding protein [Rhodospirillales bacterium]|nr:ABC transporter ATP-binding protein [Rhodospirillales bacterium]